MKKILWFTFLIICSILASAQSANLLPPVKELKVSKGYFRPGAVSLTTPVFQQQWLDHLSTWGCSTNPQAKQKITVRLVPAIKGIELNQKEGYKLSVKSSVIEVEAIDSGGVYWAMQTLAQLRTDKGFECVEIVDYPAFSIRGFMQDVGRSYISIPELKREIAKLSQYKINVFHWHLTENQSWRLESKIFPMLNDSINTTRMKGKYYTIAEARDLVAFCKAHNVMLIPEIDMPGHSAAFERTFRHSMQSKEGMKILKLLMEEVCQTFSEVEYLHIGTDEVKFTNPDFVHQMVDFLRGMGKKVISWSPGWKYKPGEVDMLQLWSYKAKQQEGIPAIDSKFHYLNHFDAFADIVGLYNSKIYGNNNSSNGIVGVIMAVWHDRYIDNEESIIIQNQFYPNMLAIAERSWAGGGREYFDVDGTNLTPENLPAFAAFERKMLWHKQHNFEGYPFAYVKQSDARWWITDAFPNDGDLTKSFPVETKIQKSYTYKDTIYNVRQAIGSGVYLRHAWGKLMSSFYKEPKENHTAYAYTWVYSPKKQNVGLWFTSQNYSRSEMDLSPPAGKWDYRESRFWINNVEILPPVWTATHRTKSNEIPLGNENFESRPPLKVELNKGWNKILIKLPIGSFSIPEVRLTKWMFNAAFVTLDGKNNIDGLLYSDKPMID